MLLARERPPEILTIDENHAEVGRGVFGLSRERPRRYPFRVAVGRDHIDLSIGRLADGLGFPPEVPSYVGDERLEVVWIHLLELASKVVFRRCHILDAVRVASGSAEMSPGTCHSSRTPVRSSSTNRTIRTVAPTPRSVPNPPPLARASHPLSSLRATSSLPSPRGRRRGRRPVSGLRRPRRYLSRCGRRVRSTGTPSHECIRRGRCRGAAQAPTELPAPTRSDVRACCRQQTRRQAHPFVGTP